MYYKYLSILALAGCGLAQQKPSLIQAINSTSLLSQLQGVLGLVGPLAQQLSNATNITILAPSNTAFGKIDNATLQSLASDSGLITALLQYHVLNGTYNSSQITNSSLFVPTYLNNSMFANVTGGQVVKATRRNNNVTFYSGLLANSSVSQADISWTGGLIHVIDTFLTLPQTAPDTMSAAGLTSLRGALGATNLTDAVSNTPNLTIFGPTNDAIQAIGSGLANLSTAQISDILKYHVVASTGGPIGYSSNLQNGTKLQTLGNQSLEITTGKGGIFVNNARVVTADILIANGVLHIIDAVLNPTNQSMANTSASAGSPAFSGASSVSQAPYTSGLPSATTTIPAGVTSAAGDGAPSSSSVSSSNSKAGAAGSMPTGVVGLGALLGAAVALL